MFIEMRTSMEAEMKSEMIRLEHEAEVKWMKLEKRLSRLEKEMKVKQKKSSAMEKAIEGLKELVSWNNSGKENDKNAILVLRKEVQEERQKRRVLEEDVDDLKQLLCELDCCWRKLLIPLIVIYSPIFLCRPKNGGEPLCPDASSGSALQRH